MPKQLIHTGRAYSLIPMKEADGSVVRGEDGQVQSHWYNPDYVDTAAEKRLLTEGFKPEDMLLNDHEPHAFVTWSKGHEGETGGPGDDGFVHIELNVTPEWMRRKLYQYDRQAEAAKAGNGVFGAEPFIVLAAGPLSWKDLNILARTSRESRDGAFGKPE